MGQCYATPLPALSYQVNPGEDLDMKLFIVSDSVAYNRGLGRSQTRNISGVRGAISPNDYFPSIKKKRRTSKDEAACRLVDFSLVEKGSPSGLTAKILLTTKLPRLKNAGPPTLDILFRDRTKVRAGYQRMSLLCDGEAVEHAPWIATSVHFDEGGGKPRFRIQVTRESFPFLVQLFDARSNSTCASIWTHRGSNSRQQRIVHGFLGNVNTAAKAKQSFYSDLLGVLDEEKGILAFQNGLQTDLEKAVFCLMFLMRTRLFTFRDCDHRQ